MRRLICLALAMASLLGAAVPPFGLGGGFGAQPSVNPLSLPLLQQSSLSSTFTFLGSFKAPTAFSYAGGAISTSGTTLYLTGEVSGVTGNPSCIGIGSMTIPTLSGTPGYTGGNGTATLLVSPTTYIDGGSNPLINWGDGTACGAVANVFTGSLVYNGTLYLTGGYSYDAARGITSWIITAATNLANNGFGTPNGASTANNTYPRFFAGSLGLVPTIWQSYLGGPVYVTSGGAGTRFSIVTSSPAGFMFSTFNPASVNPSGGNVQLTELLDYYFTEGNNLVVPNTQKLSFRSFAGPFGTPQDFTLATAPTAGATTATLASDFVFPYPAAQPANDAPPGYWQVTFSDGETRNVNLTSRNNSTAIPTTGTFAALTCSPSCTTAITIAPFGDNYMSEYDGPFGYGFFVPGSKTFLFISVHPNGPLANRFESDGTTGTSPCDPNGQSSLENAAPFPPDTNAYTQLQVTAYDATNFVNVKQGSQTAYVASPSWIAPFPGWQNLLISTDPGQAEGCVSMATSGGAYFDPNTDILYIAIRNADSSGHTVIEEYSVTPL